MATHRWWRVWERADSSFALGKFVWWLVIGGGGMGVVSAIITWVLWAANWIEALWPALAVSVTLATLLGALAGSVIHRRLEPYGSRLEALESHFASRKGPQDDVSSPLPAPHQADDLRAQVKRWYVIAGEDAFNTAVAIESVALNAIPEDHRKTTPFKFVAIHHHNRAFADNHALREYVNSTRRDLDTDILRQWAGSYRGLLDFAVRVQPDLALTFGDTAVRWREAHELLCSKTKELFAAVEFDSVRDALSPVLQTGSDFVLDSGIDKGEIASAVRAWYRKFGGDAMTAGVTALVAATSGPFAERIIKEKEGGYPLSSCLEALSRDDLRRASAADAALREARGDAQAVNALMSWLTSYGRLLGVGAVILRTSDPERTDREPYLSLQAKYSAMREALMDVLDAAAFDEIRSEVAKLVPPVSPFAHIKP